MTSNNKKEILHYPDCTWKDGDKIALLHHSGHWNTNSIWVDEYYAIQCPICKAWVKLED